MTFLKISKTQNDPKNTQKPKIQKIQKDVQGSLKSKKFRKKLQLELKNIKNDIFKMF